VPLPLDLQTFPGALMVAVQMAAQCNIHEAELHIARQRRLLKQHREQRHVGMVIAVDEEMEHWRHVAPRADSIRAKGAPEGLLQSGVHRRRRRYRPGGFRRQGRRGKMIYVGQFMSALCLANVTPICSAVVAARTVAQVVRDHSKGDTASELREKGLNEDGRTQRRATDEDVARKLEGMKDLHARLDAQDKLMEDSLEALEEIVEDWKHQQAGSKGHEAAVPCD